MSKLQFGIVCVLLLGVIAGDVGPRLIASEPTYEYKVIGFPDEDLSVKINGLGYAGWDLVSARRALDNGKGAYEMIFRRLR